MAWQEVLAVKKDNRHELVLSGNEISERLVKSGLDLTLFELVGLNYVNIHDTVLDSIPDEIEKLVNLQTLVLHSNKLEEITSKVTKLSKLKVLDLSHNKLKSIPDGISGLSQLTTLNVANNELETFPAFVKNAKLAVIDASNNKLKEFPDVCHGDNVNLFELKLSGNEIDGIPDSIGMLSLKVLYLNVNKIKSVPGELSDCSKLKDFNLKDNPLSDKRLLKLVNQCHTKQVLDYVKQHCVRSKVENNKNAKKGKKIPQNSVENEENKKAEDYAYKISVLHCKPDSLQIVVKEDVTNVRAHLAACIVLNLKFTEDTFRKFLQLQTKLHDTVCDKRNSATIATHDLKMLSSGDLVYTALPPNELVIKPLNRVQTMTGAQLFSKLQMEADNLRKEKKRSTYSGIHKYLYLLEGKQKYPCLLNPTGEVISFPPITNSDITKMSMETQSLLIEVTSATSHHLCRKVADTLLKEMVPVFGNALVVQQVKNVDSQGNLKSVYPSRADLNFDNSDIFIERE